MMRRFEPTQALNDNNNNPPKAGSQAAARADVTETAQAAACPEHAFVEGLQDAMPGLKRYARYLTRSDAAADDLTQDTMEKAIKSHRQFRRGTNLEAWLFTILQNRFRSDLRRDGRRGHHLDIGDHEHLMPVSGDQAAGCDVRDFARAFARLPLQERATLYLIGVEGMSYAEAAELLDVEVGTIKSRTSRARQKLEEWMARTSPHPEEA
ncbi:MAG: sigma-70 family RNA polymerase sigma factor [Minwuia sp.]|uniref:sigma-70 family RNA polymerase sigma factor n=1 Tax=Minwuia sp. TaxID=2493630 RepID=UPI003A891D5A